MNEEESGIKGPFEFSKTFYGKREKKKEKEMWVRKRAFCFSHTHTVHIKKVLQS